MRLRLRAAGFFALAVVAITCTDAPTSPRDGHNALSARHISMSPSFSPVAAQIYGNLAAFGIEVTEVHVHLTGPDGSVRDTTIVFPAGQDSLVIEIPVDGGGTDQTYTALLELRNDQHLVLFSGTQSVVARTGSLVTDAPPVVPLNWTGPGNRTKVVTVGPADTTVAAAATIPTHATAIDSSGAPVTDLIVRWTSSDATLAAVTSTGNSTATVVGQGRRGVATISAITPTSITGISRFTLIPPPSRVVVVSGGGQTGVAGSLLAAPLVVEVQATDNLPVPGTPVTFRVVTAGGAVTTATATSDALGRASTTLTLGKTGGTYQYEVASGALPVVSVNETATPAPPAAVAIVSGNAQTDSVGRTLAAPFVVKVTDQFGGATNNATVTFARVTGSGTLGTATSTTGADGLASSSYTLGNTVGGETVNATVTGVSGSVGTVSFAATAISRGAAAIALVSGGGQSGPPGATLATPIVSRVADALNNPVANASVVWTTPSVGTTFTPASAVTDALGQVSTTVKLGTTAGPVVVSATTATLVATASLTIVPGTAAIIAKVAGDAQTAEVATNVPVAPSVKVTDASGNVIAGAAVVFTVASGGGSVTAATASTDASGVAAVGSWKLGNAVGANTLTATAGPLSTAFSATAKSGAAAKLAFVAAPPANITVGATVPTISVRVADALDNPVAQAGIVVTATAAVSPSGGTSTPATATTDATGLATFTLPPYVGPTGTAVLTMSATNLTSVASSPITIGAGAPSKLGISTQPSAIAVSGAAFSTQPVVQLADAGANAAGVAGVSVTVSIASGGGTLSGTLTRVSGADGVITFADLAISGTTGARTLSFASTGLTPATSNAIGLGAGAAASITKSAGDAQSATAGATVAIAPSVAIKDAAGNPVAGASVTFAVATGGGSVTTPVVTTDVSGVASVGSWKLGDTSGPNTLTATNGVFTATFTATASAGTATKLAFVTAPAATIAVGASIPSISGRITDALNNPVATAGVSVSATAVLTPGGQTTVFTATTDATGLATFTPPPYEGPTGTIVLTLSSPGLTSIASSPFTVTVGAPSKLAIKTQPSVTSSSGAAFGVQPVLQLTDAGDNPTAVAGKTVTAFIGTGGGTLNGTATATSAADGSITFTNLGVTGAAGSRTLGFDAAGLTGITSNAIAVGAGAASAMTKNAGDGQSATAGSTVSIPPSVLVKDAAGNPVAGAPVTFAISAGGGTLTAATSTTNASGIASVGSWTLGNAAGTNTLTAASGGLTATFTANGTAGAATTFAFVLAPPASVSVGGSAYTTSVQLVDGLGNHVSQSGVSVTATEVLAPATAMGSVTAASDASGVATLVIPGYAGSVGTLTITYSATSLASLASSPITVLAGAPAKLLVSSQPTVGIVGAVIAQPVIQLADAGNNPVAVAGMNVTASVLTGGGTLGGTTTIATNATGKASFTDLVLSGLVGTRTFGFASGSLASATSGPITFAAGAASQLTLIAGSGQTAAAATAVAVAPSVKVSDASGNGISGVPVSVTPRNGSSANGSAVPIILSTNASGLVTLGSWILGPNAASAADTVVFTSGALTGSPLTLVASASPAAADRWLVQTQPPTTVPSGAVFSTAPVVRLADAFGNTVPTAGVPVTVSIATGGGTLGGSTTVTTNASGLAVFSNLSISGTPGTRTLAFDGAAHATAVSSAVDVTVGAPALIALNGGGGQTATVLTAVAVPPSVKVTDASNNPVSAVVVTFTVVTGGSSVSNGAVTSNSVTVNTDASGVAQLAQWTLSDVAGVNRLNATAAVASGSPLLITATGTAGVATKLLFTAAPSTTATDGVPLAQQPVVRVTDELANLVNATDVITAVVTSGSGTVSNFTATAVGGVATFSGLTITGRAETYTLSFRSGALAPAASAPITLGVGSISALAITTQPSATAQSGVSLAQSPVVQMRDVGDNSVPTAGVGVSVGILSGGGTITPVSATTDAAGVASFANLTITGAAGPRVLQFSSGGITVSSGSISVTSGAPATVVVNAGNLQSAVAGSAVGIAPNVLVTDANGFAVVGATVTFAVTSGGGSLTGGTATTNASGIATLGSWTLGTTVGTNTLTATTGAASANFSATATVGAAARLAFVTAPPASITVGAAIPTITAQITDALNNPVSAAGVLVTATSVTTPGGFTTTATATTDATGLATFTLPPYTGPTGTAVLTVSASGLASAISSSITLNTGAPAKIVITTQPSPAASSGAAFSVQPTLQLTDVGGNATGASINVTASVASGGGSLGGTTTVASNATGVVTFTNLAISGTAGTHTLGFNATGLAGATSNTVTISAGTAAIMAKNSGDGQTATAGSALPIPPSVLVTDASGNPVAGVSVSFAVVTGGGGVTGTPATTNASGIATVGSWTIGGTAGANSMQATTGALTTTFTATGTAGAASGLRFASGVPPTITVGAPIAPITVQVIDASGNPVNATGATVILVGTVAPSGATFSASGTTDASGLATLAIPTYNGLIGTAAMTVASAGLSSASTSPIPVNAGSFTQLRIATQPSSSVINGAVFPIPAAVQLADAGGNAVAGAANLIALKGIAGSYSLTGSTVASTDAAGLATFSALSLTGSAGLYALRFTVSGGGPISPNTTPITLTAGAGTVLGIITQPASTASSGVPLATQPVIQLQDASGNPVTTSGVTVTATISSGSGSLANASAVTDATGKATFVGLAIAGTAGTFTLNFDASGYTTVASSSIALGAGIAARLSLTTGFSDGQSGVAFPTQPVVRVLDASNNQVAQAGIQVSVAIATGGGTLSGTIPVTTDASGVASFTDLVVTGTAGSRTFSFSAPGLPAFTFGPVNIAAGAATQLIFVTQPASTAANAAPLTTQPVLQLADASGNPVALANVSIDAALVGQSLGTLSGAPILTDASGKATFSVLSITGLVGNYTINFTASGYTPVASGAIALSPGAATQLQFLQEPTNALAAAVIVPPIKVALTDVSSNVVNNSSSQVILSITPGTGSVGASMGGTLAVTLASGVATFGDLSVTPAGTGYTLTATTDFSRTINRISNKFDITPSGQAGISVETGAQVAVRPNEAIPEGKIVFLVHDAALKPKSDVLVNFQQTSDDCSLFKPSAITDALGHVTVGVNVGRLGLGCQVIATATGFELPAIAQVASVPLVASHAWIAPDSSKNSFEVKENWLEMSKRTAEVPSGTSVVYVPAWITHAYPRLGIDQSIRGVVMDASTFFDLGGKTLTTSADINAPSGFMYNGAVIAAGTNVNISGLFETLTLGQAGACVGAAPQTANLRSVVSTAITAACGVFVDFAETAAAFNSVPGSFVTVNTAGALIASTAASFAGDSVSITGDGTIQSFGTASFGGRLRLDVNSTISVSGASSFSGVGSLSSGVIELLGDVTFTGSGRLGYYFDGGVMSLFGNFTQKGTGPIFQANALHQTYFRGSTTQTIQMETPSANSFGEMNLENTGGGVTLLSSLTTQPLDGFTPSLNVSFSQLSVPTGVTYTHPGDMYFHSGGTMLLNGTATFRSCNSDGAVSPISGSGTANGKPAGSVSCFLGGGFAIAPRTESAAVVSAPLRSVTLRPFPVRPVTKTLR